MKRPLEKLKSRGYWQVIIRPTSFNPKMVDIEDLWPMLEKMVVRIRGWYFPHLDHKKNPHIDMEWIGQEFDWEHHKSAWRFYQSGLFIHLGSIRFDWRDESSRWPADNNWKPGMLLGVGDTVITFTEIMELASRLSLSKAGDQQMYIGIVVHGLKGRSLYVDSNERWPFDSTYTSSLENYPNELNVSRQKLVADHKDLAIKAAQDLFKRFGWSPTVDVLRGWQEL